LFRRITGSAVTEFILIVDFGDTPVRVARFIMMNLFHLPFGQTVVGKKEMIIARQVIGFSAFDLPADKRRMIVVLTDKLYLRDHPPAACNAHYFIKRRSCGSRSVLRKHRHDDDLVIVL